MNMPDITPAQIVAACGQVIALAVAFGVDLTGDQQKALLAVAVTIGSVLLWVDKEIRKNRAANADKIAAAKEAARPVHVTVQPTPAPAKPARARPPAK